MDQVLVAMMLSLEGNADVYLPVQVTGSNMQVEPGMVQASDGKWYGIICSSQQELHKLPGAVSATMKL